jgi:hypothetical protein
MLHGIWAQAPYLHNGSVPTLGQLICADTRPVRLLRGNINYDERLVGFEWLERPAARYAPNEMLLVKEYDTTIPSKANTGHVFGSQLCPTLGVSIRPATAATSKPGCSSPPSAHCSTT